MRKHSVRKWLHAVLDLLPVLILPVFAIYEINHDHNEPISVEVSQNEIVSFNQLNNNNNFVSRNSGYLSFSGDSYSGTSTILQNDVVGDRGAVQKYLSFDSSAIGHLFYCSFGFYSNVPTCVPSIELFGGLGTTTLTFSADYLYRLEFRLSSSYNGSSAFLLLKNGTALNTDDYYTFSNFMLVDLTSMYGVGNEPSTSDFYDYLGTSYRAYTTGTKTLIKDVSTVTYADTDVGSQMIYSLYKPVVNYFNFNNVFNFGAIYDWFQLNMFNGNAPMVAFIVWNIIVYEFIMDILFLVYSVFMFVIDFASDTLERFTGWSRKGC